MARWDESPNLPAWADEDTAEFTIAERLRYDVAEFNAAHGWTASTGVLRTVVDFLRGDVGEHR
ncbi:hypothetical protein [Catellatospora chokoriensis]|uniref:Uncharacterized protein n=1 Tax=Catellatospora chokoriensis TaxID=310353 RepID=A0A8J3NRE7_9ACTN|nr:hypothetical protein [Catellatospora chokoriensis]GIF89875.1 hypothetical protein Cch02nite_33190 [Catellatospora chokoriensis]